MAAALTFLKNDDTSRELFLYDTFEGMTPPTEQDVDCFGGKADQLLKQQSKNDPKSVWCVSRIDEVRKHMATTAYPMQKVHLIEGKVEETIPQKIPDKIALLRLDTDWYESTRHELVHLYPRLVSGGVLIIDDYGHWQGCRRAVDEYFSENDIHVLLNRIDYTGRICIKTEPTRPSISQRNLVA